jgi:hypothetical protein
MKKIILPMVALSIATQAMAQSAVEKAFDKYRFGVFGAIGSSNLNPTSTKAVDDNNTYSVARDGGKLSLAFGLSAEKVFNERYSIYSGLSLEWMGGKIVSNASSAVDTTTYADIADYKYNLQYLQVPLGIKLKATNIDRFQIYTQLGLDAGFLIGRKATFTVDGDSYEGEKLPLKVMNPFSLAYHVGLGTEFKVTKDNSAYFTVLYRNGFLDHTLPGGNASPYKKFSDGTVRSNNIMLRIGYYF